MPHNTASTARRSSARCSRSVADNVAALPTFDENTPSSANRTNARVFIGLPLLDTMQANPLARAFSTPSRFFGRNVVERARAILELGQQSLESPVDRHSACTQELDPGFARQRGDVGARPGTERRAFQQRRNLQHCAVSR